MSQDKWQHCRKQLELWYFNGLIIRLCKPSQFQNIRLYIYDICTVMPIKIEFFMFVQASPLLGFNIRRVAFAVKLLISPHLFPLENMSARYCQRYKVQFSLLGNRECSAFRSRASFLCLITLPNMLQDCLFVFSVRTSLCLFPYQPMHSSARHYRLIFNFFIAWGLLHSSASKHRNLHITPLVEFWLRHREPSRRVLLDNSIASMHVALIRCI